MKEIDLGIAIGIRANIRVLAVIKPIVYSCVALLIFSSGTSQAQDLEEAARENRIAAEQGDAGAQNSLGVSYANGQGVAQDYAEAIRWYRAAAEQRLAEAQFNLGLMYQNGRGVAEEARTRGFASLSFGRFAFIDLRQIIAHSGSNLQRVAYREFCSLLGEA